MKPYCWLLCLFLAFPACETEDECSVAEDCDDQDFCTEDRCRIGRCSHLSIPGCCHDDTDCGPSFGPYCDTESDRCVECLSDADCDSGFKCNLQTHKCVPNLGAPCTKDDDCGNDGRCLSEVEDGYPGGFCAQACQSPEDCGDHICEDAPDGLKTCLPPCISDQDCRPGYMCRPTTTGQWACFPHCTSGAECPEAGTCDLWQGRCVAAATGGENGAPCTGDEDCKGFCKTDVETGAPGGVCMSYCSPSKITCPPNNVCAWQLNPYVDPAYACMPVFSPQVGCRPEYAPMLALGFTGGDEPQLLGVCQPACRGPADCSSGNCNRYSGLCDDPEIGGDHGAACGYHDDCKGLCLFFWAGGYCTGPCRPAAQDCPGDDVCIDLGILALCTKSCQSDPDCRDGYVCDQNSHSCLPPPQP
jgi:hypothetical protein